MAFGLGVLRLSPGAFWAMSPRELDAAASGLLGPPTTPPARGAMEDLMRRFPDRPAGA